MKKLIVSICTLAIAASLFGTSTFAWFSMNKTVTATGMSVKATVDASLVITTGTLPTDATITKTVQLMADDADPTVLTPSTHAFDNGLEADAKVTYSTGLKAVKDASKVDPTTGEAISGQSLDFVDATNAAPTYYYVDYIIYIASAGTELAPVEGKTTTSLTISLTLGSEFTDANDMRKGVTVDFYATKEVVKQEVNASTYIDSEHYLGKLNLAGVNVAKPEESAILTITDITIPQAKSTFESYALIMRVYIDGAAKTADGQSTYVKNTNQNTNAITFGASFKYDSHDVPAKQE